MTIVTIMLTPKTSSSSPSSLSFRQRTSCPRQAPSLCSSRKCLWISIGSVSVKVAELGAELGDQLLCHSVLDVVLPDAL
jgi:hypothetical protein